MRSWVRIPPSRFIKMNRLKAIIKGDVQGIGYRWFVQDTARALMICGWVKNLYDGDVEIEAEGLLARVFQHEIDHLDGKLIIDYRKSHNLM